MKLKIGDILMCVKEFNILIPCGTYNKGKKYYITDVDDEWVTVDKNLDITFNSINSVKEEYFYLYDYFKIISQ